MVREGKLAEVTCCRRGETVDPVAGRTKEPILGKVCDGEKAARKVSHANVAEAELSVQERPARVRRMSASKVCAKQVQAACTVDSRERSVQPKVVGCRDADRDMTLKTLFRSLRE